MVSNARLDLPDPDSPVSTIKLSLGRSMSTPRRLCSRAPCTTSRSATAVPSAVCDRWRAPYLHGGPHGSVTVPSPGHGDSTAWAHRSALPMLGGGTDNNRSNGCTRYYSGSLVRPLPAG